MRNKITFLIAFLLSIITWQNSYGQEIIYDQLTKATLASCQIYAFQYQMYKRYKGADDFEVPAEGMNIYSVKTVFTKSGTSNVSLLDIL